MRKTGKGLICLIMVVCLQLSAMAAVFAAEGTEKIILASGRSNYELTVNGAGSYTFVLPTSVTAAKITAVPNTDGEAVTVTVEGTDYAVNDANTFAVKDNMQIVVKVGGGSEKTYTVNVILSVYEEIKSLIRTINAGKDVPAMLNALKPRYEALPDWAKELISNRDLLGYEPAPAAAAEGTGNIVLDGGRTIYEIALEEGKYEYTQDIASSFGSIAISEVPHKEGDTVALQAGGTSYTPGQKIPLVSVTEIIITVSGSEGVVAYKLTVNLSVEEEIKALNSGIAVLASTDIDLRFKGMVLPLLTRYNALSEEAKAKIVNAQALLDAKETIDRLEKAAAEVAAAAEKTIKDLNDGIAALSGRELTIADSKTVDNLMEAYDLLTSEQKERITGYAALEDAAAKVKALQNGQNPATGDTNLNTLFSVVCVLALLTAAYAYTRARKVHSGSQP